MITRTWQNDPAATQPRIPGYNPLQWVQDFEQELLENNRKVFSQIYNTDVEEYWLKNEDD